MENPTVNDIGLPIDHQRVYAEWQKLRDAYEASQLDFDEPEAVAMFNKIVFRERWLVDTPPASLDDAIVILKFLDESAYGFGDRRIDLRPDRAIKSVIALLEGAAR
jgi:hypothetical protein